MPVRMPNGYAKAAAQRGMLAELEEYVLSTEDVAALFEVTRTTVVSWRKVGRRGWVLASRRIGFGPRAQHGHRVYDVVKFAQRTGLGKARWSQVPEWIVSQAVAAGLIVRPEPDEV